MKLIRDGYINIIDRERLDISPKDKDVKLNLILDKFKEEAIEFLESNQRDPDELADLMQVVVDWGEMNNLSFDIVNHRRKEKLKKLGGFRNFIVLKDEKIADTASILDISEEHF